MKRYTIHDSMTGELLASILCDHRGVELIESLSEDSPEGFFKAHWAGDLLPDLGDRTVYAIVH